MQIKQAEFLTSGVDFNSFPEEGVPEFVFCGRSNVGKSSFINMLVNRKSLARTSSNPGKTQTINFYLVNDDFYLVDAPGYGFAMLSKKKQKKFGLMMEDYIQNRPNLKQVFMLVDFRHKPTNDDLIMYNYLKHYRIPVTIVGTKSDKVGITLHQKQRNMILEDLDLVVGDDFVMFSNVTKVGKKEVYNKIERTK